MAGVASKRPDNSAFKQQTLKAWRPILTPQLVILLFSVVGIIFVPIGGIILSVSNQVRPRPSPWRDVKANPTLRRTRALRLPDALACSRPLGGGVHQCRLQCRRGRWWMLQRQLQRV